MSSTVCLTHLTSQSLLEQLTEKSPKLVLLSSDRVFTPLFLLVAIPSIKICDGAPLLRTSSVEFADNRPLWTRIRAY